MPAIIRHFPLNAPNTSCKSFMFSSSSYMSSMTRISISSTVGKVLWTKWTYGVSDVGSIKCHMSSSRRIWTHSNLWNCKNMVISIGGLCTALRLVGICLSETCMWASWDKTWPGSPYLIRKIVSIWRAGMQERIWCKNIGWWESNVLAPRLERYSIVKWVLKSDGRPSMNSMLPDKIRDFSFGQTMKAARTVDLS